MTISREKQACALALTVYIVSVNLDLRLDEIPDFKIEELYKDKDWFAMSILHKDGTKNYVKALPEKDTCSFISDDEEVNLKDLPSIEVPKEYTQWMTAHQVFD